MTKSSTTWDLVAHTKTKRDSQDETAKQGNFKRIQTVSKIKDIMNGANFNPDFQVSVKKN